MDHQPIVTSADMSVTVFADVPQTAPPLPLPRGTAGQRFFPERIEAHYTRGMFPADSPWSATFVRLTGPFRRVDGTPSDAAASAVYPVAGDHGLPAWAAEFVAAMLPEADDADADVDADRYRWGGTR